MMNEFYTIPKAAMICNVSRTTMWRWVKRGEFKAFPGPRGIYKIRQKDLKFFIQKKMKHLSEPLIFRKKILIVDDEPNIIRLLIRMLASGGYQTESALNGFEAGIKITKFEPALVILDLFMPKMDGFDLCEQIKNNPDTAHIKVVAITGFDGKENRDRIMKAGANGYFPKPLNESDLLECIGGLLKD